MVGYVCVGSNDFDRSAKFYDELLTELGASRMMEIDNFIAWTTGPENAALALVRPFDEQPASAGNGVMVALAASSKEQVDAVYAKAISLGASDEGKPGPRGDGFYAGYFRDPDGNKLNAYFIG